MNDLNGRALAARQSVALVLSFALLACQRPLTGPTQPGSGTPAGPAASSADYPAWLKGAQQARQAAAGSVSRSDAISPGFEQNIGQFDGDARFIARVGSSAVLLRPNAITTLVAPTPVAEEAKPARESAAAAKKQPPKLPSTPAPAVAPTRIDLRLLDSHDDWQPKQEGLLRHVMGYFQGKDPKGWIRGVLSYERVVYRDVYSGIDLAVYRDGENVKYDFVVAPGASPARIRINFEGAASATVEPAGDLVVAAGDVVLRHKKPFIYQERDGKRVPIEGGFVADSGVVTFNVAAYDESLPLVIDPTIVEQFTGMLAGGFWGHAKGLDVATAANGDGYMTGWVNVFRNSTSYSRDAFVSWFDGATGGLIFSGLFSGSKRCSQSNVCDDDDQGNAITVDPAGEIYFAGTTSSFDFQVTADAFDADCGDDKLCGTSLANPVQSDAFALHLTHAPVFVGGTFYYGLDIAWGTFIGGGGADGGNGIDVDSAGNIYVAGWTRSGTFPVLNATQSSPQGNVDAFVVGLAPAATQKLIFGTYLGSGGDDFGNAVAVDRARNRVYVTGSTWPLVGSTFPASDPAGATARSGDIDAFVAFFEPTGALQAATFVRGSSDDSGSGIAVGADGFVYISGSTSSPDINGLGGPRVGSLDAFVAKLHFMRKRLGPMFARLDYVTYLGGSDEDHGNSLAIDAQNRAYVVGSTRSTNFPTAGTPQSPLRATKAVGACGSQNIPCPDSFIARLTETGTLDFAALFGAASYDSGNGVALRHSGDALVASESYDATASIPHYNALLTRVVTGSDLEVAKSCSPSAAHAGSVVTCTLTVTNHGPDAVTTAEVTDLLSPAGWFDALALGSSSCAMSRNAAGLVDRVICPITNLAANSSRNFSFRVIPARAGTFTDHAVSSFADDWNPGNDASDAMIAVQADVDLNAFKAHSPEPTALGSVTNYEVWVGNQGPDLAADVKLTDTVPAGLEILSVATPTGSCSPTQGVGPFTITCDIGSLVPPMGLGGTRAVGVQITARATAAGTYTNTATVSGLVTDPVAANDVASDTLLVRVGRPRLTATINAVSRVPTPGGTDVIVEIEIHNTGDGNAQRVRPTGITPKNVVGTGTVTRVGSLPSPWPLLEAGRARSYLVAMHVTPGVTKFDVALEGDYQDMSGSNIFSYFNATAPVTP